MVVVQLPRLDKKSFWVYNRILDSNKTEQRMLTIKAGDKIRYTSGAGTLNAVVESITIGPTAKPGLSIAWLNLTVPATVTRKYETQISIPADPASLKGFKVEKMA